MRDAPAGLDQSNFSRLRARLVDTDVAQRFFDAVVKMARREGLLSDEHFTVDGTLIEAWASLKSVRAKDGPPPPPGDDGSGMVDFMGVNGVRSFNVASAAARFAVSPPAATWCTCSTSSRR